MSWLLYNTEESNAFVRTTFIKKDEKIIVSQAFKHAIVSSDTDDEPNIDLSTKYQVFGTDYDWEAQSLVNNYFSSWEYEGSNFIIADDINSILVKGLEEMETNGWTIFDQELWLNSPLELRLVTNED